MDKNIVIIHYNTPKLTECLIRSINKFVDGAKIYIFDNSDKSPFTAKFDNLTIIDNTKGQIINFDKWLEKYPRRNKSCGRLNKWGSAKHAYSVEKCIELFDDGFLLLDSDVLLKRDISNLFSENYCYVGDVTTQPSSEIKRVLPFVCFINTKLCKKNNVHYFDDNHMHGLYKTPTADRYDTGAALYLSAEKLKNKDINYSEYCIHYGSGSWTKEARARRIRKYRLNAEEWLNENYKLWTNDETEKIPIIKPDKKKAIPPVKKKMNPEQVKNKIKSIAQLKKTNKKSLPNVINIWYSY